MMAEVYNAAVSEIENSKQDFVVKVAALHTFGTTFLPSFCEGEPLAYVQNVKLKAATADTPD